MKVGHVEAHLSGANPRTWRDDVEEAITSNPQLVIFVGAGAVVVICSLVVLLVLLHSEKNSEQP